MLLSLQITNKLCAKRACRKTSLPGDCRLLQFFEVPFDKWRDIDLYALENAYLESGWDVARTAVVLMARLRVHRVRSM